MLNEERKSVLKNIGSSNFIELNYKLTIRRRQHLSQDAVIQHFADQLRHLDVGSGVDMDFFTGEEYSDLKWITSNTLNAVIRYCQSLETLKVSNVLTRIILPDLN